MSSFVPSTRASGNSRRIVAFPYAGNIYSELLYAEVKRRGVEVIEGTWTLAWLKRQIRSDDVLHIHFPPFLYFTRNSRWRTAARLWRLRSGFALAKARGARIVWTAHNLHPHDGGRRLWAHRIGGRLTVAAADAVCVHGPSAAALVGQEYGVPAEHMHAAPHGHWIDLYPNTLSREVCRTRLKVAPEEYLYLHIGRCLPYKGIESLIEAFATVPQPARLLIAGKFESPEYLADIEARARRVPHVEVVPKSIPDDELQIYLNAADCLVLPYRAILTSGSALLGLSFGRPVVGPDMGAMRDHVAPECGLLYPADRPDALAQALIDVRARHFDQNVILERAREFTWSRLADALLGAADIAGR